jgi:menaquinone-dependent protoporphyrinogen oxidase
MSEKILVAYASRTGFTAGVADSIGKTLVAKQAQVEVLPMIEVSDLSPYQAVVAGSAIQNKQWLPEAIRFIQANREELARRPFAAFLVCMTLAMSKAETYRPVVSDWLQPVRRLVKPLSEGLFAGGLEIAKIPSWSDRLKFRLSVAFGVWSEGDHRDWDAIYRWSESLHPLLIK